MGGDAAAWCPQAAVWCGVGTAERETLRGLFIMTYHKVRLHQQNNAVVVVVVVVVVDSQKLSTDCSHCYEAVSQREVF
jgi:hypothetical protein